MFSRQHYEAVADIIRTQVELSKEIPYSDGDIITEAFVNGMNASTTKIASDLRNLFKENDKFDERRFLNACNVDVD